MIVGGPQEISSDDIRVFHVDDDHQITDLTSTFLERESPSFEVITQNSPTAALDRIEDEDVDCIVSDYDMPEMDGLEFLEGVREKHPDLPFILFTGKGSEEIASEAISRGVTDYLQKGGASDQYTVLANRIENAVSQHRAEKEVEKRSKWFERILEHSSDYVMIVDGMGKVRYVSPAIERVMGYEPHEIVGRDSFENIHPEDLEYAANALAETIEQPEKEVTVEFRAEGADGTYRWLESRGRNFLDDPLIGGVMVNVRDITERKQHERELEARKDRLKELTNFLSHDVKNQISIIRGYTDLLEGEHDGGDGDLEHIQHATDRIEQMIEKVEELVQSGQGVSELEAVQLRTTVEQCWGQLTTTGVDADLRVDADLVFEADRGRLLSLFENLLGNAIKHAGSGVTVRVGRLEERDGFYVEDDGQGIPPDERDRVFDTDYTSTRDGTGLGLAIVKQVADAHGWSVEATESDEGGARFEISQVEVAEDG